MALNENDDAAKKERQERRKRKRWGVKQAAVETANNSIPGAVATINEPPPAISSSSMPRDNAAKILAMQESVRARLAAAKAAAAAQEQAGSKKRGPADSDFFSTSSSTAAALGVVPPQVSAKKAKVYELDLSITAPTYQKQQEQLLLAAAAASHPPASSQTAAAVATTKVTKKAPPSNPYLAHTANDNDDDEAMVIDKRLMTRTKPRQHHHRRGALEFVEPGKYQEIAEQKRQRELQAAAAGFLSGRKQGHTIQSAQLVVNATSTTDDYYSSGDVEQLLPPRMDAHPDTSMPLIMEWWDVDLLPSKLKKQLAALESQALTQKTKRELQNQLVTQKEPEEAVTAAGARATQPLDKEESDQVSNEAAGATATVFEHELERLRTRCWEKASLSYSKTAALVQHIVPITSPLLSSSSSNAPPQAVLHLTAKERRRQRKLRRQEQLRERQDLQAAGLLPAPEPRLTLQNFMQVLGHQAVLDPSQTEQKVQEQRLARQRAHEARNAERKLTKEQRAQKRALRLQEDTTQTGVVHVALYLVRNMSHPYHRTKVDVNAQQYNLTGLVLECQASSSSSSSSPSDYNFACVLVEGGPKGIQKFDRLMTVRMKWTGPNDHDDDYDDDEVGNHDDTTTTTTAVKFDPDNRCERVWRGMAVQRLFRRFLFQTVTSPSQARQVFASRNVAHYWDHILLHHAAQHEQQQRLDAGPSKISLPLKLVQDDNDEALDNPADTDEDVVMKDA